jgi:hypothetical protein
MKSPGLDDESDFDSELEKGKKTIGTVEPSVTIIVKNQISI